MWNDPIVEEVRKIREEHAAALGNDLHLICEHYRKRQNTSQRQIVTRPGRSPIQKNLA